MGTITLSFSNNSNYKNKTKNKNKNVNKEKVLLTYHDCVEEVPEYYSYIFNNKDVKFNDSSYMINKISSSKYIAKKNYVSKIPLTYVFPQENIEFKPGYFTYNDNEIYLDKPIYDEVTNSYKGNIEIVDIYDKEIKLYIEE
jgi:hypothetical protein